jgi:TRAP-type mannitol/chloroaromatic compound transport system substrate-binding protein
LHHVFVFRTASSNAPLFPVHPLKRRDFVTAAAGGLVGTALTACGDPAADAPATTAAPARKRQWKMVTTWPNNFPGLGTGATYLAQTITAMTGGRITVSVYGAGELVPAFEVFDAVANGTAQIGHAGSYYWKGKAPAAQLFGAVPFGMNAAEIAGWLYYGGGRELWRGVYERFGLVPALAGHTGVQMGGWYNREINTIDDLRGLKMRIPGLGGEVFRRAGGVPVNRPGGELYNALQTGDIDATEWVGPSNDLAWGLHKAAKYYYYPGWHEPNAALEAMFNKEAFEELPEDLQSCVMTACAAAAAHMHAEYTATNPRAFKALVEEHNVDVRPFPADVLKQLKSLTDEVLNDIAEDDAEFANVLASYRAFSADVRAWHDVSERAYYEQR